MSDKELEITPKAKVIDPFTEIDANLEWLELDHIPERVYNPLLKFGPGQKMPDPVEEMIDLFMDSNYLHFAVRMILGLELPPYQVAILDTLWNKRLPMLIGSRGAAKSFILAVYALMRMVLHPGCKIVIVGAGLRQSRQVFDYMAWIWERAPVLRDISGAGKNRQAGPRREVDRYQFEIGDSKCYAIPIGDGTKIRGLRANYIIADEFASIPPTIFNLVVQGFAVVASDPIQKIKEAAVVRKLKSMGIWNADLEKDRQLRAGGNQIIYSGTAHFYFNHFYKYFKTWHDIISSKGDLNKTSDYVDTNDLSAKGFNWKDYAIIRLPYTHVPEGLMDETILAQAKATLSNVQFLMEYGAVFASDTDGFYKRSVLEAATTNKPILVSSGKLVQFSARKVGDPERAYVIGVDPAADADNAAVVTLELHQDHRRIVNCWTTNRKKYLDLKKVKEAQGEDIGEEYYKHIALKIRELMRVFNTEHIIMDKHGGGSAIAEALRLEELCQPGEMPIYQVTDPEDPKPDDLKRGLHILELIAPTNDINSEANHGMLKDFQDRVLLFPMFDTVELAKSIEIDEIEGNRYDTYEDLVHEVEDLKTELTSIMVTASSSLGKETFDTPTIKGEQDKKGRLRKDRFSALLYANYYARRRGDEVLRVEYKPVGGTKETVQRVKGPEYGRGNSYYGPGMLKFAGNKNGNSDWLTNPTPRFIKRR